VLLVEQNALIALSVAPGYVLETGSIVLQDTALPAQNEMVRKSYLAKNKIKRAK